MTASSRFPSRIFPGQVFHRSSPRCYASGNVEVDAEALADELGARPWDLPPEFEATPGGVPGFVGEVPHVAALLRRHATEPQWDIVGLRGSGCSGARYQGASPPANAWLCSDWIDRLFPALAGERWARLDVVTQGSICEDAPAKGSVMMLAHHTAGWDLHTVPDAAFCQVSIRPALTPETRELVRALLGGLLGRVRPEEPSAAQAFIVPRFVRVIPSVFDKPGNGKGFA